MIATSKKVKCEKVNGLVAKIKKKVRDLNMEPGSGMVTFGSLTL